MSRNAPNPFSDRLFDCCWVELHGYARPELVIQKRMKPKVFAIDEFLYEESGKPLSPDAPLILAIYATTISPRRKVG